MFYFNCTLKKISPQHGTHIRHSDNAKDCPGACEGPGLEAAKSPKLLQAAAKSLMTSLLQELLWAEGVTLHSAAAPAGARALWFEPELVQKLVREQGCLWFFSKKPAVCFLYFCDGKTPKCPCQKPCCGHQQLWAQAEPASLQTQVSSFVLL